MIAEQRVRAHCVGHLWGKSGNDNEQIGLEFELAEGEDKGSHIVWTGTFTDRALEYTERTLRACGWEGNDLTELGRLTKEVELVIRHEEYKGEARAVVAFVNDPSEGRGFRFKAELTDDEVRSFAARMRSRFGPG